MVWAVIISEDGTNGAVERVGQTQYADQYQNTLVRGRRVVTKPGLNALLMPNLVISKDRIKSDFIGKKLAATNCFLALDKIIG